MCIGSNWVNEAQDLMFVTKFEDFPNSLIPTEQYHVRSNTPLVDTVPLGMPYF